MLCNLENVMDRKVTGWGVTALLKINIDFCSAWQTRKYCVALNFMAFKYLNMDCAVTAVIHCDYMTKIQF